MQILKNFAQVNRMLFTSIYGVVAAGTVAARSVICSSLARTSGTLMVEGLNSPVEVVRDKWGVPHIYARNSRDLYIAQGYIHAQDRLWQMELQRRLGHGQLAEIFGVNLLETDRFVRTLGLSRIAREEAALLRKSVREVAEAYVHGINMFLAQHARRLPVEFSLLRFKPRQWEIDDILVLGKVFALNLSENWTFEVLRSRIIEVIGSERASELGIFRCSHDDKSHHYSIQVRDRVATLSPAYQRDAVQGSNAWVVGGTRTHSQKPMLASDPHLALQIPSLWYENHLEGGDYHASGASIAGCPGIMIGHNKSISWGITNSMIDVQDLYIEEFDAEDPTRYRVVDQWEQARTVYEAITIRGQRKPFIEEVKITRHGPILPMLAVQNHHFPQAKYQLALRWTALEAGTTLQSLLAINQAHNWSTFRSAVNHWSVPSLVFVYADREGHIGKVLAGNTPIRAQNDGQIPVPGWSDEYEWQGFISQDLLPQIFDPDDDCIVTANNPVVDEGETAYPICAEWLPEYRAERIHALLEEIPKHDQDSFSRIQGDCQSLPGLQLIKLAGSLSPSTELELKALGILLSWDGMLTPESVGGMLYAKLSNELLELLYRDITGPLQMVISPGITPGSEFFVRSMPHLLKLSRSSTTWPDILQQAWKTAIVKLQKEYGSDVNTWHYGRMHLLILRHPLGALPILGKMLNRGPFRTGGDINTVCMGHLPSKYVKDPYYVAPSYRLICDVNDWNQSVSMHPMGQSGQPGSPHYGDFTEAWLKMQYHPMPWDRSHVAMVAMDTLLLVPTD